ncbi:MAG TPA: ribosome recycling factor [Thermoanaerobaculia bacterium]|nr:ribosome recycling factor [Thermoanaerobaculia bacterium]
MQQLFRDVELKMKHAVDHLHDELKRLRTGRASLTLLEGVTVDYYGTATPLNQVANLSVADANLIVAQPWDSSQIPAIERSIAKANLGLNPSSDGKLVRIPVPPLTEERRRELVRKAHELAEVARNAVRQARREGNDQLKGMERDKEISQDDEHRGHDEVQKLHDHYIKQVNDSSESKEADILQV